jgi:anti-sigma factor RsiW
MSLHLDGLLSAEQTDSLQTHLAWCPTCARQWQAMSKASQLLLAEPMAAPASDLAVAVAQIISEREVHQRRLRGMLRVATAWLGAWALAGLALAVLLATRWGAELRFLLFDVGLPVADSLCTAAAVLRDALWSASHALLTRPTVLLLISHAVLAMALAAIWTCVVMRQWNYALEQSAQ